MEYLFNLYYAIIIIYALLIFILLVIIILSISFYRVLKGHKEAIYVLRDAHDDAVSGVNAKIHNIETRLKPLERDDDLKK